jgi:acyl carrier protein
MDVETAIERFVVDEIMLGDSNTKIDPNESLISSGVLDSLALLRLIAFLEEQMGVTVDDSEVIPENFESINEIKSFIEKKKH